MATTKCYQTLASWMYEPFNRDNRAYLESHLELIGNDIELFVESFIHDSHEFVDELTQLHLRLQLLQDARRRGGQRQPVREAYNNMIGGLILDTPDYVLAVESLLDTLMPPDCTERMVSACKLQLHNVTERTRTDTSVFPEITAELLYQPGDLFVNASPLCLTSTFERAISYYKQALEVYTLARYPLQRTRVLVAIGNAYKCGSSKLQTVHLEKAMHYYELSLLNYNEGYFLPRNNS